MRILNASLLFLLFISLSINSTTLFAQMPEPKWAKKVGAKKFPKSQQLFYVNDYGAVSDTITINTKAIQAAVDAAAKNGGGIVVFRPGTYVTGSVFLKTNVHLRIDLGVLILGSQNFDDYPDIDTRVAGIEMKWPAALINMIDVKNAAITGKGVINARGKFCWDKYWSTRRNEYEPKGLRWVVDYDVKRIRTILTQNATDVTIKDITVKNAGFWTVQLLYSTKITVDGIIIRNNEDGHGPSTDGVDVDSSSWVLIQNCDIDCNDDNFCLKAGRDADGLRVNRPTEYVVIRNSLARRGGGLVTLGSETSGGIRHVLATDLVAIGTGNAFHIKSAVTRGGTVEDIHIRNITMDSVKNAIKFNMNWNPTYSYSKLPVGYDSTNAPPHWNKLLTVVTPEQGRPVFRNIHISNIHSKGALLAFSSTGLPYSYVSNIHFKNIDLTVNESGPISYSENWTFENVIIRPKDGKPFKVENIRGIDLEKISYK